MTRAWLAVTICFVLGCASAAENETLTGTGTPYSAPLYLKWIAAYTELHPTFKLDYQTAGKPIDFKAHSHDLLGTGSPVSEDMLKTLPGPVLHIPTFAAPLALIYNLPGVTALKLNGAVLASIFLGKITLWNDPQIAALNPGVELPGKTIVVVHRGEGSSATWVLTHYLAAASEDWKKSIGQATAVKWPAGKSATGNEGVAALVTQTEGGIGCVEFGYALGAKLPRIVLINKSGQAIPPSIAGTEAAAQSVTDFPADLRLTLVDTPGAEAYPLNGYYFFVLYRDLSYLKNKEKAEALVNFLSWSVSEGQKSAKPFFAPLPPELRQAVEAQLKTIVFDGQPILK